MTLRGRLVALEENAAAHHDEWQVIEVVEVDQKAGTEDLIERIYWKPGSDVTRIETYRGGEVVETVERTRNEPMKWEWEDPDDAQFTP